MRAQRLVLQPRLSLEQLSLSVDSRVDVGGAKRGHPPDEVPRARVDGLALTPLGRAGLQASARVASGLAGFIRPGVDVQDARPRLLSEALKVEPCRLEALLLCGCAAPGQGPAGRRRRKAEAEQDTVARRCHATLPRVSRHATCTRDYTHGNAPHDVKSERRAGERNYTRVPTTGVFAPRCAPGTGPARAHVRT